MGITDLGEIISMWAERTWYDIKAGFRQLVRDFNLNYVNGENVKKESQIAIYIVRRVGLNITAR